MERSLSQLHPEHARLLNEAKEELIIYVNKVFEKFFNTVSVGPLGGHSSEGGLPQPVSVGGPGNDQGFIEHAPLDLSTFNWNRSPMRYDGHTESSSTTTATPFSRENLTQQLCNGGGNQYASSRDPNSVDRISPSEPEEAQYRLGMKGEVDGQLVIEIGDCDDLFNVSTEPCQCDECLAQLLQSPERDVINGSSSQLEVQFVGESVFGQPNFTSQMPTKTSVTNSNNNQYPKHVERAFEESVLFRNSSNSIESPQFSRQTSASESSNISTTVPSTSSSKRIKRKVPSEHSRTEASKSDRSNKKQRSNESSSTKSKSKETRKVSNKSSHRSSSSDRCSQLSARSDKRPEVKIKVKDKASHDRRSSRDRRTPSSSRSKVREEQEDSVSKRDATKKATDWKDSSSSRKETKSGWDQRGVGGRARGRRSSADYQRTSRRSPSPPPPLRPLKAHNAVVKYKVINLKCRQCSETFERINRLEEHEFNQHNLKPIPCFYFGCDESVYTKGQLLEHVRECHANDVDWKCKHCGRVCPSEHQLESHIAMEHRKGSFGCAVAGCGHRAQCRLDALRHYNNEHFHHRRLCNGFDASNCSEDSKYKVTMIKCPLPECHRYFTEADQMEEHLMTAHGRKPIACIGPGCESSFSERSHLSQHIEAVHPEVKRWLCSVSGCDFGTADQEQMCHHQVRFHQEGRFRCAEPNCEFVDKYRDAIIKHFDRAHRLAGIH